MAIDEARPLPVNDVISISGEETQYTILASDILANDIDYQGDELKITKITETKAGTAVLNEAGNVVFTVDPRYKGIISFRYKVEDAEGNSGISVRNKVTSETAEVETIVYLKTPELPSDQLFEKIFGIAE